MSNRYFVLTIALLAPVLTGNSAAAENLIFRYNNPNFGGNPNNGPYLFALADAQKTATIPESELSASGGGGAIPGIGGGGSIGGPTIIIPIGNLGPDALEGLGGNTPAN